MNSNGLAIPVHVHRTLLFSFQVHRVPKNFDFFCYFKNWWLVFLDYFDVLMSKIIFKKLKNIILIYFGTKSTLKSYRNRTPKQDLIYKNKRLWREPCRF